MPMCVLKRGDLCDHLSSRENEARFLYQNEVNLRDRETKWPPTLIRLLDVCDVYDLDPLILTPMRITNNRSSCLDVILTNIPTFMKVSGVIETGLSGHDLVYTSEH